MRKSYTDKQIKFLRDGYKTKMIPGLTIAFNAEYKTARTEKAIKSALQNRKITCGRKSGRIQGTNLSFSADQINFIKETYKGFSLSDLTKLFNEKYGTTKKITQLRAFTRNHKITSGRTGRYEKGAVSWNTGTIGVCHGSCTSFKKGHVPANLKPMGSERIDVRDKFILVKIPQNNPYTGASTRYKHKHVVIWEQKNGPVPKGMVVFFIDGDQTNCNIGNLMLVSRALLLRLNKNEYKKTSAELKPSLLTMSKLETKIFSLLDKGNEKNI